MTKWQKMTSNQNWHTMCNNWIEARNEAELKMILIKI